MYLHLGSDYMISKKSIIGVFDLDSTTVTQITRDYLAEAQTSGQVEDVCENLPKSFIVSVDSGKKNRYETRQKNRKDWKYRQKIVISPLASSTLRKRSTESAFE